MFRPGNGFRRAKVLVRSHSLVIFQTTADVVPCEPDLALTSPAPRLSLYDAIPDPMTLGRRLPDSTVGADHVAKSAPDGHTILYTSTQFAYAPTTFAKLPYDPLNDLVPIRRCEMLKAASDIDADALIEEELHAA